MPAEEREKKRESERAGATEPSVDGGSLAAHLFGFLPSAAATRSPEAHRTRWNACVEPSLELWATGEASSASPSNSPACPATTTITISSVVSISAPSCFFFFSAVAFLLHTSQQGPHRAFQRPSRVGCKRENAFVRKCFLGFRVPLAPTGQPSFVSRRRRSLARASQRSACESLCIWLTEPFPLPFLPLSRHQSTFSPRADESELAPCLLHSSPISSTFTPSSPHARRHPHRRKPRWCPHADSPSSSAKPSCKGTLSLPLFPSGDPPSSFRSRSLYSSAYAAATCRLLIRAEPETLTSSLRSPSVLPWLPSSLPLLANRSGSRSAPRSALLSFAPTLLVPWQTQPSRPSLPP